MKTSETLTFVGNCMGLYNGTAKRIDELCEKFKVDLEEQDVYDAIIAYTTQIHPDINLSMEENNKRLNDHKRDFGIILINTIYSKVISDLAEEFCMPSTDMFSYECDVYGSLEFDGNTYNDWESLHEAVEIYTLPRF